MVPIWIAISGGGGDIVVRRDFIDVEAVRRSDGAGARVAAEASQTRLVQNSKRYAESRVADFCAIIIETTLDSAHASPIVHVLHVWFGYWYLSAQSKMCRSSYGHTSLKS